MHQIPTLSPRKRGKELTPTSPARSKKLLLRPPAEHLAAQPLKPKPPEPSPDPTPRSVSDRSNRTSVLVRSAGARAPAEANQGRSQKMKLSCKLSPIWRYVSQGPSGRLREPNSEGFGERVCSLVVTEVSIVY